jgi:hypothetical protein
MLRQKRTSPVGLRRLVARVSELESPNGSRDMEATKAASPVKSVSPRLRTRNSGFSQNRADRLAGRDGGSLVARAQGFYEEERGEPMIPACRGWRT